MNEPVEIGADAVKLRDAIALLRAVGAVALGIAALSRELREWRRDLSRRHSRRGDAKGNRREDSRPDHA